MPDEHPLQDSFDFSVFVDQPGDVIFTRGSGVTSRMNLLAQRAKRSLVSRSDPWVGFSHAAFAVGLGEVVHSLAILKSKEKKRTSGINVESIHEIDLLGDSVASWDVLRSPDRSWDATELRARALGFAGFAYNERFDAKEWFPNTKYNFKVYCSEFVAQVLSEMRLVDNLPPPSAVDPNALFARLHDSGWRSVKEQYVPYLREASADTKELISTNALTSFTTSRTVIAQTLQTHKLLLKYQRTFEDLVRLDSSTSPLEAQLTSQRGRYLAMPVSQRIDSCLHQLDSLVEFAWGQSTAAASSREIDSASQQLLLHQKVSQWSHSVFAEKSALISARILERMLQQECQAAAYIADGVAEALDQQGDPEKLGSLLRSSSSLTHFFSIGGLAAAAERSLGIADKLKESPSTGPTGSAVLLNQLVLYYLKLWPALCKIETILAGEEADADLDVSLREALAVFEALSRLISTSGEFASIELLPLASPTKMVEDIVDARTMTGPV